MLFGLLAIAMTLGSDASLPAAPAWAPWTAVAAFHPGRREVDNWRRQSVAALDLDPETTMKALVGDDPRGVTRCVRLNNYWCIKRAGWAGEIASDAEGHVAFASAKEGAAVAALLLRRYYVDFKLHTARAIVSRWAPMQCGVPVARASSFRPIGGIRRVASLGMLGPMPAVLARPSALAPRGLGNTLRARFLASHPRGGIVRPSRVASRRSSVPDLVGPLLATPSIMAGSGAPLPDSSARLAMLPFPGIAMGPLPGAKTSVARGASPAMLGAPAMPILSCAADSQRIANYAARAAEGAAKNADSDLGLFDETGMPTDRLARVLMNMAAVEIGPLRASGALVESAMNAARNAAQNTRDKAEAEKQPASAMTR